MRKVIIALAASVLMIGCSDTIELSCDKPMLYQTATASDRVEAPENLSDLAEAREMPVPSAAPAAPRKKGEPCLDIPPRYLEDEVIKAGDG